MNSEHSFIQWYGGMTVVEGSEAIIRLYCFMLIMMIVVNGHYRVRKMMRLEAW